jgi:hypothetical protein
MRVAKSVSALFIHTALHDFRVLWKSGQFMTANQHYEMLRRRTNEPRKAMITAVYFAVQKMCEFFQNVC